TLRRVDSRRRCSRLQPNGHPKSSRPALRRPVRKKIPQCRHRAWHFLSHGLFRNTDRSST
ncbi:hypothetical protein RZS08_55060, partial [Arthrospira platensis SPKY1]|nr:hypothetical protein [Arthrospira platensis SPKY1]